PAAPITLAEIAGKRVAFLPRHGLAHEFPPHKIPYRANAWALRSLGILRVFGPCAVGSLRSEIKPGDFVVCDQIADFTRSRENSFFDGDSHSLGLPKTEHLTFADPYCPEMRRASVAACKKNGVRVHDGGTCVVVEGPRFSTRAESAFFQAQHWSVINMTQMPEAALCRELGMCYANISLVTDYDVGVTGGEPVSHAEVLRVFKENNERVRRVLVDAVAALPKQRGCECEASSPKLGKVKF
ncbi:MAG: S-methyl-5'-thioadenosine phosphorylase, partial [Candidatus Norongarragalinales archaeon]